MKYCLIGNGFIYLRHIQAIKSTGGEITNYDNADYIVILTPNDLHIDMINMALRAGKKVLCEKPLALRSEDIRKMIGKPVFTVLQLREHPLVKEISDRLKLEPLHEIKMEILVHRDENYYKSWKGDIKRSGGILFNLGVHYFDLLLYLFGEPTEYILNHLDGKTASGKICGKNYFCNFKLSTNAKENKQKRSFTINGKEYNFSSQDNLSYEDLHKRVYKNLLWGEGVGPEEALKSIRVIENLCNQRK